MGITILVHAQFQQKPGEATTGNGTRNLRSFLARARYALHQMYVASAYRHTVDLLSA